MDGDKAESSALATHEVEIPNFLSQPHLWGNAGDKAKPCLFPSYHRRKPKRILMTGTGRQAACNARSRDFTTADGVVTIETKPT